jgi:hypothetical protein
MKLRRSAIPQVLSGSLILAALLILLLAAHACWAADWTNNGGNAGRNGLSTEVGPTGSDLLWSGGRTSLIAWHPVTEGNRVFTVRQIRWPNQQPGDSPVVAMDLSTGHESWAVNLPYNSGDWTTWIAGVKNGMVFASRSGNGASIAANIYALDVYDGHTIWVSQDMTRCGPYDGVVFTSEGDLIVGSFLDLWRIRGSDGATLWHQTRLGSVSSACGAALYGNSVYIMDAAPGGNELVRYDLASGARLYQSPLMPGFTCENAPMVGPDGTIYLNRAQNNPSVDFLYAFTDNGMAFIEKWHVPTIYNPYSELGLGPDGSVYAVIPGPRLARLDPNDGATKNAVALPAFSSSRFAVDAEGKVFFSNGGTSNTSLFSYNADLSLRWSVPVPSINIGGPSLGQNGTVVVCGTGTDMRAYRSVDPAGVAQLPGAAIDLRMVEIAPNPVRDGALVSFSLRREGPARLEIFDVTGQRAGTILAGTVLPSGRTDIFWDGRDDAGARLPSGSYYLRLTADGAVTTGRIILTR